MNGRFLPDTWVVTTKDGPRAGNTYLYGLGNVGRVVHSDPEFTRVDFSKGHYMGNFGDRVSIFTANLRIYRGTKYK